VQTLRPHRQSGWHAIGSFVASLEDPAIEFEVMSYEDIGQSLAVLSETFLKSRCNRTVLQDCKKQHWRESLKKRAC
jgi:hypothetical protein